MNEKAIRAGCNASDAHLTCSYPDCKCKQLPIAIQAALNSVTPQSLVGVEQTVTQCAACVPTTWLDSLLSGPNKVADFKDGPAVERLLQAIRSRILAIVAEESQS